MKYTENFIQGNYSKGRVIKPTGIVTHHNYLSIDDLHEQMTKRNPIISTGQKIVPASYDVVIWKDGSRTSFAKDYQRAWHAGKSILKGKQHCNNFTLGACFHGNTNAEPLTYNQIESYIEWLIPMKEKWNIAYDMVVDHRTVAPDRKVDLNVTEYNRLKTAIKYLWL